MNQIKSEVKNYAIKRKKIKAQRNKYLTNFKDISPQVASAMSQNKALKCKATFTIAEVALDICLPVARKQRVTAKRSFLKIARLIKVSF